MIDGGPCYSKKARRRSGKKETGDRDVCHPCAVKTVQLAPVISNWHTD